MVQARGLSIKCQCVGAPCPCIECPDQGVLKFSCPVLEGKGSLEDLLFILNLKRVRGEQVLDMSSDCGRTLLQEAPQHPHDFKNGNEADKSRALFAQLVIDNLIRLTRLLWIILQ